MSDRTLDSVQAAEAIRRPSFEMQQAALAAGFGSVRDWALAQCVDEIRALRQRVDALEGKPKPTQADALRTVAEIWDAAG